MSTGPVGHFRSAKRARISCNGTNLNQAEWEANEKGDDLDTTCFPAGTLVSMGDGSKRPIETLKIGDLVYTHQGRVRRVKATMSRLYTGQMVGLHVRGVERPVICTADHKIATASRVTLDTGSPDWVPALELKPGSKVITLGGHTPVHASVSRFETALPVFDIEVEEDHSFIAGGIAAHNCRLDWNNGPRKRGATWE